MSNVVCKFCNKGHDEKICWSKKQAEGQNNQAHNHVENDAEEHNEEQLFVATCYAVKAGQNSTWLVDSVCFHHIVRYGSMFKFLDRTYS